MQIKTYYLTFGESADIKEQYAYIKVQAKTKDAALESFKAEYPGLELPKHIMTKDEMHHLDLPLD